MRLFHALMGLSFFLLSMLPLRGQDTMLLNIPSQPIKIQVALLIDVSGSMDGLISQTQGQLWKMANFLSQLKKNDHNPIVEIALISYGGLVSHNQKDAIVLESHLVSDLDQMAERLFQLQATGSQEHCAEAMQLAIDSLHWSNNKEDLKIVIIAGNESFDQGELSFYDVCATMMEKNILLNTIFCGGYKAGVDLHWQEAAFLTGGKFANINQHIAHEYMDTPFDSKMASLYRQFKETLILYGPNLDEKTRRSYVQDNIVKNMGNIFYRDRIMFLINPENLQFQNDLIYLFEDHPDTLNSLIREHLPFNYQNHTPENLKKVILQNQYKRNIIKEAIELYNTKIEDYLRVSLGAEFNENSLESVLLQILKEQAIENYFYTQ